MEILITNDDGYKAKGIHVLADIMSKYGNVTVIAPKETQSGMSMAVNLGGKTIEYKKLTLEEANATSGEWSYLDGTPAACVKFALNTRFLNSPLDLVISGINHGSNASTASCYSGTLGAAQEGILNGVPSIGVSLDSLKPDADFTSVEKYFPIIYEKLIKELPTRNGIFYNINFPKCPADEVKGIRVARMGLGRWVGEFKKCEGTDTASTWVIVGDYMDDPNNPHTADNLLMDKGYITIVAHQLDNTDYKETERLQNLGFDIDF